MKITKIYYFCKGRQKKILGSPDGRKNMNPPMYIAPVIKDDGMEYISIGKLKNFGTTGQNVCIIYLIYVKLKHSISANALY